MKKWGPIKTGDVVIMVLVALLSLGAFFVVPMVLGDAGDGVRTVVVSMDSEEIHRFPLRHGEELETIEVPITVRGEEYTAVLEMQDGAVRLRRLPTEISPLAIHADMGWIKEPYQMIISLPIRLVITIEAGEDEEPGETDVDTMVY